MAAKAALKGSVLYKALYKCCFSAEEPLVELQRKVSPTLNQTLEKLRLADAAQLEEKGDVTSL